MLAPWGQAGAATVTEVETFSLTGIVNNISTQTKNIDKVQCPEGQILTSVRVVIEGLQMDTDLGITNSGSGLANYTITSIDHRNLDFTVPSAGITVLPVDALPNIGLGASEGWAWLNIPIGGSVNVPNIWVTNGAAGPYFDQTYVPADANFGVFTGGGTFSATLSALAEISVVQGGTFNGGNQTQAQAQITVSGTCLAPGLTCNGKSFDIATIADPDGNGEATATLTFTNTGQLDLTDVVITDNLDSKMTYVPGTTTVNGAPGPDPVGSNTLVWSGVSIPAGQSITITYDIEIVGMSVKNETICNDAYATSAQYGLSTESTDCSDCITYTYEPPPPPVVPAFNLLGLLAFAGLIPLSWVLIGRRKK
jgi:uncharacterized repeat protein (TIGR01451 family)